MAADAALTRVARHLPVEAAAARTATAEVLAPVLATRWPSLSTRFSLLTNTGAPLELAWTSADPAVRWTAEVAPPECPEPARARLAAGAARRLTGAVVDVEPWERVQDGRRLRYGSWLGVRHRGADRTAKVYVELPSPRAASVPVPAGGARALTACERVVDDVTWRMAGLHPDGAVEVYARAPRLEAADLARLLTLLPDGRALPALLARLLPVPGLPRPSGFSVTLDPRGAVAAVTWFCVAKAVWRDDAHASAALRPLAASTTSQLLYDALAGGPPDGRWRHAMVGAGCDAAGRAWVQTGLRPS